MYNNKDHFVHALSQWETTLHCNIGFSLAGLIHKMIPAITCLINPWLRIQKSWVTYDFANFHRKNGTVKWNYEIQNYIYFIGVSLWKMKQKCTNIENIFESLEKYNWSTNGDIVNQNTLNLYKMCLGDIITDKWKLNKIGKLHQFVQESNSCILYVFHQKTIIGKDIQSDCCHGSVYNKKELIIDHFTVSLHSPNSRQIACWCKTVCVCVCVCVGGGGGGGVSKKWWKFSRVTWVHNPLWLRQSQPMFKPTDYKRVIPANLRPCPISHSQSCSHQARTVYQSKLISIRMATSDMGFMSLRHQRTCLWKGKH